MSEVVSTNLKLFKIIDSPQYIKIFPLLNNFKTQVLINKRTSKVLFGDKETQYIQNNQSKNQLVSKLASLIMGLINIQGQKFLVYAQKVYLQHGLPPNNISIYQIAAVDFIPFSPLIPKTKAILQIIQKQILSFSFYFSFQRDLTLSFQKLYESNNKSKEKYFFNQDMLIQLIGQKNFQQSQWRIPIIQGHYSAFQKNFQNLKVQIYLISRRSKYQSGTRFYNRGIDDNGNCANFIQTQQIIVFLNQLISFTIISGSAPVFWQQKSQLSQIKITRNQQLSIIPFKKHLKSLAAASEHVVIINLLQKKKQNQNKLINQFEKLMLLSQKDFQNQVKYSYFDINQAFKIKQPQNIPEYISKLESIIKEFRVFQFDINLSKIVNKQRGIFRINCLDCLARTNNFMQILAFFTIYSILQKHQLFQDNFKKLSVDLIIKSDEKIHPFLRHFRTMWQEKGQYQSLIYTGSNSAQGKKTKLLDEIQNSIVSIQRYYNQKFNDQLKQQGLDILLYHKSYEPLFRTKHKIPFNISIITWNVNATDPQKLVDLKHVIKQADESDLIVIGIQQMIELNTNNVMNDNTQESKKTIKWQNQIEKILTSKQFNTEYIFVQKIQMVGLFLIVFISKKWKYSLRSIHKDLVKCGMKIGMSEKFGNKGGLIIRLNIFQTSITFICAHLAAHQNKVKQRISDFVQIHKKAFQQNQQSIQNQIEVDFSDYKFFFGDLNFRLDGQFKQIKEKIESNLAFVHNTSADKRQMFQKLISSDQLFNIMNNSIKSEEQIPQYFNFYRQCAINFFPTYKLDKHTGQYSLQKSRNPSYCDRILYWQNDQNDLQICPLIYSDIKAIGSDHRPIIGKFKVNILRQNRKNSESIIMQESYLQDSQFWDQNTQQIYSQQDVQDINIKEQQEINIKDLIQQ